MEGKVHQVQGIPIQEGDLGYILRNDANGSVYPHNISFDFLQKQFHKSIDINQPAQIELHDESYFSEGQETNIEAKPVSNDKKKRSMIWSKMNEHKSCLGVDLKLKLSPPSSSSWISIPSSSQGVNLSSILNSDENLGVTSKDELPSLILMGCTRCYMYVMVSETDPKCPKCQNHMLLNKFQVNSAKKPRTSRI